MGQESIADKPEEELDEKTLNPNNPEDQDENPEITSEDDGPEGEDDEEKGFQVTRQAKGSQPNVKKNPVGVRKRIDKLKGKVADAEGKADAAQTALDIEKERNLLNQIKIQQLENKAQAPKRPDPKDFDDDIHDPKFIEAQEKWDDHRLDQKVQERLSQSQKTTATSSDNERKEKAQEQRIEAHVLRARKLETKDFDTIEDKAVEVLGDGLVNGIIEKFDGSDGQPGSEVLLYYLGKNPQEAAELRELVDRDLALGLAEIGRLRSELKVESKSKPALDPDDEIEGSSASGTDTAEKKLNRLRDKAAKGGSKDMKILMDFKKKLAQRGKGKK